MTKDEIACMQGMADCMDMVRQELVEAGIIGVDVPPMFVANAVLAYIRKVQAQEARHAKIQETKARHWKTNHDAQIERARVLQERPDMPLERVNAYQVWGTVLEDYKRFQACRHAARSMVEDGGEPAFIEAIDKYRVDHGV